MPFFKKKKWHSKGQRGFEPWTIAKPEKEKRAKTLTQMGVGKSGAGESNRGS